MVNYRSFRIVSLDEHMEIVEEFLREEGYSFTKVPFYHRARICFSKKPLLGSSALNKFGHIYIQDLASMLPPLYLNPKKGETVLDLCASPGGKTMILSELVGDSGIVISNEPNRKRYITLQKNIERLNLFNVITTSYQGEKFPNKFLFKYILLDVPCSGWGTVDKNPRVMKIWQGKKIKSLIELQRKLIERSYYLLKPGGRLIYSTCTTNPAENEEQINWALKRFSFEVESLEKKKSFLYNESFLKGVLCIKGHEFYSQGFFIACLRKTLKQVEENISYNWSKKERQFIAIDDSLIKNGFKKYGLNFDKLPSGSLYLKGSKIFFKKSLLESLDAEGVYIGNIKGDNFLPNVGLWKLMDKTSDNILKLNKIDEIKKIITGASLSISTKYNFIQLFYKCLPLCLLSVKGGRCLITK